jgi:hypothetical protein
VLSDIRRSRDRAGSGGADRFPETPDAPRERRESARNTVRYARDALAARNDCEAARCRFSGPLPEAKPSIRVCRRAL